MNQIFFRESDCSSGLQPVGVHQNGTYISHHSKYFVYVFFVNWSPGSAKSGRVSRKFPLRKCWGGILAKKILILGCKLPLL